MEDTRISGETCIEYALQSARVQLLSKKKQAQRSRYYRLKFASLIISHDLAPISHIPSIQHIF